MIKEIGSKGKDLKNRNKRHSPGPRYPKKDADPMLAKNGNKKTSDPRFLKK